MFKLPNFIGGKSVSIVIDKGGNEKKLFSAPVFLVYASLCLTVIFLVLLLVYNIQANYFHEQYIRAYGDLASKDAEARLLESSKTELMLDFEKKINELNQKIAEDKNGYYDKLSEYETLIEQIHGELQKIDEAKQSILEGISGASKQKGAPAVALSNIDINTESVMALTSDMAEDDTVYMSRAHFSVSSPTDTEISIYKELEEALEYAQIRSAEFDAISVQAEKIAPFISAVPKGFPVDSVVTSKFGKRANPMDSTESEYHIGIDLRAAVGTPVKATGSGTVQFAGNTTGYGYLVIINHGYGYVTYYGHNSKLLVKTGAKVSGGDSIALSGNTGNSTGPHVHYEVRYRGALQDPMKYK